MKLRKAFLIASGIIILHLLVLSKLKFTAWPEMLLWPYLVLHGWMPYKDIAIAHTPLLIMGLSVFYKIFGSNIEQLRLFTWAVIIAGDLVVFWVVNKLRNAKTAVAALSLFVVLLTVFDANGLWFDLMLVPLSLFTYFLITNKKFLWAGTVWAVMFFTKQTAVWFLIPIGIEIWLNKKNYKRCALMFFYGTMLVLSVVILYLWVFGMLSYFYDWAIHFGIFILPKSQGQIQLPGIKSLVISMYPFLLFAPLIQKKRTDIALLVWAVAGGMGAYPRFEYFHFLPAIPFLSVAGGIFFSKPTKNRLFKFSRGLFIFGLFYLFAGYFLRNYNEGIRFYEQDVKDVVRYVKDNTSKGDKIFVLNWWDNIYSLSGTLPAARPWVPQLEWYQKLSDVQDMEAESLILSKPKMIIFKPYTSSGLSSFVPDKLYSYVAANYYVKETIDGIEILVQTDRN